MHIAYSFYLGESYDEGNALGEPLGPQPRKPAVPAPDQMTAPAQTTPPQANYFYF